MSIGRQCQTQQQTCCTIAARDKISWLFEGADSEQMVPIAFNRSRLLMLNAWIAASNIPCADATDRTGQECSTHRTFPKPECNGGRLNPKTAKCHSGPSAACPMPSYAVLVFVVTAVIAYLVGKRKGGLDSKQSQVLCSCMHAIGSVSTDLVFSFGSNSAGCRGKRTYPAQRRKSRPDSS